MSRLSPLALVAALAALPSMAAQSVAPSDRVVLNHDTGWASNIGDELAAVHAFPVHIDGAAWMRLAFDTVELAGAVGAKSGAFLRITSMLDGQVQLLDSTAIAQWRRSSAYFNGDALLVEVLAYPGTGASRVVLQEVTAGLHGPLASQCGLEDDRVLSTDLRMGRLLPAGCTGFLVDQGCGSCLLTAGHCAEQSNVLQLNVPLSSAFGFINHPGPEDQYAVDPASVQSNQTAVGDDYAFLGVFPNSNTGLRPAEAQGARFNIAPPPPFAAGQTIRVTGYGTDFTPQAYNRVQQTHFGERIPSTGFLEYRVDTTAGNSGSPVILEDTGAVIGIHTHGGCTAFTGNRGTPTTHAPLVEALANPTGVCAQGPAGSATAYGLGVGGANVGILSSPGVPIAGGSLDLKVSSVGGATAGIVWLSLDPSALPVVGGTLLADATTAFHWELLQVAKGIPGMEITLAVPVHFCGIGLYAQALAYDVTQPFGLALTNGLELRFGQ